MLWRPQYEPQVAYDIALPALSGTALDGEPWTWSEGVVLGGWSPKALAEIGVWRRLLTSVADFTTVYITADWTPVRKRELNAAVPKSEWGRTVASDAKPWLEPDREERSFALIGRHGRADIFVAGTPTEEIWEVFEKLART